MPVRQEPSHRAEQTTQMLFGEKAEVLEIDDREWARIRLEWDGSEGWCKASQLCHVHYKEWRKPMRYLNTGTDDRIEQEHGNLWLPAGCDLPGLKGKKISLGPVSGQFKGKKTALKKITLSPDALHSAALRYMHAPYIWGGRSLAGIDCSGLSQMAYKLCGHRMPREAWQQALAGDTVDFLQHSRCGDLAFFDNADGRIVHVGMLLDAGTIIHATEYSGRVVIDRIDQGGIVSSSLRRRTHSLRLVKRYF